MINFLLSEFTKKTKISLQKKSNVYAVTDIDEKLLEYNKETVDWETEEIRLQIESYMNNIQFNIMLIRWYNVILELLWLKDVNSKISSWYKTIDFLTEKLVHMSKEMLESELKICIISADNLKREIWENSEQVKIL